MSAAIGRSVCIEVVSLGQMDYPEAIARMDTRVAARKREEAGDALLLVEHPPVITVGKRGDIGNLVATEEVLARKGVTLHHTSRGGDITFHGPGQLVGYPVLDIRSRGLGARDYVDRVEETLIRTLSRLGVESAERMTGRTGVWVEGAKVAAIGVHVSRGVTSHGFALNVCTDLSWFDLIVPCGIAAPVTSVTQLRDTPTTIEEVTPILVAEIGEIFDSRMVR